VGKPPTVVDLTWQGDLRFAAVSDRISITIDSAGVAGPSPMQALGAALAGCMTVDVAYLLTRGRHPLRGLTSRLTAERAQEDPHRFVRLTLHVTVEGDIARDAIERAIQLSREKYCSVWHSMRQDLDFRVTFELRGDIMSRN
jgi:putative redox protein